MTEDSGADRGKKELRAMAGLAAYGAISIVVFAIIGAVKNWSGVAGMGVGVGSLLFGGGRALWLLRKQRRDNP
ncbi:hypothetical protein IFT90_15480 [Frigoribacterium sp. CFBP 8766]|uniref:hypothetical protein n=1 Tax=Frigoribacterium sp. CFBP 8766 TaxID=2775273 RepID=UPI00177D17AB|nr:hypothetical protein [Frigoribacterium sp. CFBP 8766]MBD8585956.1 hypothetical protein [Frigoribacterium sp. CFBP 8766]